MQNKETLLQLVERLREAGQMDHLSFCNKYGSRPPWDHCNCIASDHNSAVDAAAKALVAKIGEGASVLTRMSEWENLSDEGLRLRCGELTAQEIRTIRAVLGAIGGTP